MFNCFKSKETYPVSVNAIYASNKGNTPYMTGGVYELKEDAETYCALMADKDHQYFIVDQRFYPPSDIDSTSWPVHAYPIFYTDTSDNSWHQFTYCFGCQKDASDYIKGHSEGTIKFGYSIQYYYSAGNIAPTINKNLFFNHAVRPHEIILNPSLQLNNK